MKSCVHEGGSGGLYLKLSRSSGELLHWHTPWYRPVSFWLTEQLVFNFVLSCCFAAWEMLPWNEVGQMHPCTMQGCCRAEISRLLGKQPLESTVLGLVGVSAPSPLREGSTGGSKLLQCQKRLHCQKHRERDYYTSKSGIQKSLRTHLLGIAKLFKPWQDHTKKYFFSRWRSASLLRRC